MTLSRFPIDDAFEVTVSELLIATADAADPLLHPAVGEVLRMLREQLQLDVAFVSEFVDGHRVFRSVDRDAAAPELAVGASNPLEESFCQLVVEGRLPELVQDVATLPGADQRPAVPFRVGGHLSTPIVLQDGRAFGTLCCFSMQPKPALRERDLQVLRQCARLVARRLDMALASRAA